MLGHLPTQHQFELTDWCLQSNREKAARKKRDQEAARLPQPCDSDSDDELEADEDAGDISHSPMVHLCLRV